jgi:hypothetical protein
MNYIDEYNNETKSYPQIFLIGSTAVIPFKFEHLSIELQQQSSFNFFSFFSFNSSRISVNNPDHVILSLSTMTDTLFQSSLIRKSSHLARCKTQKEFFKPDLSSLPRQNWYIELCCLLRLRKQSASCIFKSIVLIALSKHIIKSNNK